jgi:hypothetical protein
MREIFNPSFKLSQTLPIASDLLEAAIGCVAAKALPYKSILKQIQQVDWNIGGEIPSQHSAYVDFIIKVCRFSDE